MALDMEDELNDTEQKPEAKQPEPWLRNSHTGLPAVVRGVVHAIELAHEDALRWCATLSNEEAAAQPGPVPAIAFQLRHIAGSIDRLLTYAEGRELDAEQLAALRDEASGNITLDAALREFADALTRAEQRVRAFAGADLEQVRWVGKRRLPTTLGGLLVHVADHTQRHCGQLVTTAKVLMAMRESATSLESR